MIKPKNDSRLFREFLILAFFLFVFADAIFGETENGLTIYDSTASFKHYAYEVDSNTMIKSYDRYDMVDTVFKTKVIENKYLKVNLLPDFGGRILSIIYKPTGHEQLYQNPLGTPYNIGTGGFYYDWLMVYGGIFPTFPEPEHGKTWCLPWETRTTVQTADRISVEMRFTDTIEPVGKTPKRYDKGRTDITCIATVSVFKYAPYVALTIKLINNRSKPVDYEYWTCATLAPGSVPGETAAPANSEIVIPIDRLLIDWGGWMQSVEKRIGGNIFEFERLALYSNWSDMGIAYAHPRVEREWWGVVNHENEEGIFRIADNARHTPGMKLWTWGWRQGENSSQRFGNSARPYIELWAGSSLQFFSSARMAPRLTGGVLAQAKIPVSLK